MKLYEALPEGVTVDGKFYQLDFDFRNVFRMLEVLEDNTLLPEAKYYNAMKCLTSRPRNCEKVIAEVKKALFRQKKKGSEPDKKVTDFVQDAGLIRAAFRQAYGIDLYREKLHWIEFVELLNGIPEGTRYSEVVEIRMKPIPKPTKYNSEEILRIRKAQAAVALEVTEEERLERYDQDVQNIAAFLMSMAEKGSD